MTSDRRAKPTRHYSATPSKKNALRSTCRMNLGNRTSKFTLTARRPRRGNATTRSRRTRFRFVFQKRHNLVLSLLRIVRSSHRLDGVGNAHQNGTLHAFTNPFKKVEICHFVPLTLRAKRAFPSISTEEGGRSKQAVPVVLSHIFDSTRILKREKGVQTNLEKNVDD